MKLFLVSLLIQYSAAFYLKSSGYTCDYYGTEVSTATECSAAASGLGITYSGSFYSTTYPEGCFVYYGNAVYFNTYSTSSLDYCTSNYQCVCEDDDDSIVVVAYETVSSGYTCDYYGTEVSTATECATAASNLGLTYSGALYSSIYPEDCFTIGSFVYFNTYSTYGLDYCSSTYNCVCSIGTDDDDGSAYFQYDSGLCTVDSSGSCIYSPNYPSVYNANDDCTFTVLKATTLDVQYFSLENYYDYFYVGSSSYTSSSGPYGVSVSSGTSIRFTTDGSVQYQGFKICANGQSIDDNNNDFDDIYDDYNTGSASTSTNVNVGMVLGIVFGSLFVLVLFAICSNSFQKKPSSGVNGTTVQMATINSTGPVAMARVVQPQNNQSPTVVQATIVGTASPYDDSGPVLQAQVIQDGDEEQPQILGVTIMATAVDNRMATL